MVNTKSMFARNIMRGCYKVLGQFVILRHVQNILLSTVRNVQLCLTGNLSNSTGQKSAKKARGKNIRELQYLRVSRSKEGLRF
jgi:hypothetical protein